jgi:hypothetical protein
MSQFFFANPALTHCEDGAVLKDGAYVGQYSGMTLEQLQLRDPAIQLIDSDEFVANHDRMLTTDPVEIDVERFEYMLEVLPPCSWVRDPGSQSFYMSEFTSGNVTAHLVNIGDRYFSFDAPMMRKHADRVAKVRTWLANQPITHEGTQQ